jgi:YjbR
MLTADDFRDAALSLDGTIEGAHMGHADFRANGRIFASLDAEEATGNIKLTPEEQHEMMRAHPKMFTPAAGAWGRQGWTVVQLRAADEPSVRGAVLLAWQNITSQPRKAPSKPRTTRRT